MKIYDSLSGDKCELKDHRVSIYNCGPTVYNNVHIGNVRPLITFDVLYRFLKYSKFDVQYLHNITDIDDKIIAKAKQEHKTESEIALFFYQRYLEINKALNVLPMIMPKVSDNISGIIEYIGKLLKINAAYETNGDVYFDISSDPTYGILSHQNLQELLNGARKSNAENKKSPLDFALWKKTETGQNWKSPWSTGRPGWHTECAYFINKNIGDHTTIHGGGIDLKFPHHENENAQNYALYKRGLADIWMHVGHVNINDEKMSKSLNNFVLVKDILTKYIGNDIRWFMYQSRYESPLNYTDELLDNSTISLTKVFQQINHAFIQMFLNNYDIKHAQNQPHIEFIDALNDDLDFPRALTIIYEQSKGLSNLIKPKSFDQLVQHIAILVSELEILGIKYTSPLNDEVLKSIIIEWKKAMEQKNYPLSDSYRNQLTKLKVI